MPETTARHVSSLAPSPRGVIHRWKQTLIPTAREAPAEATLPSHALLIRAGFIRQVAAGAYTYLPLANRVLSKIERIVRDELDAAGCSELLMPALVPIEFYKQTKRDVAYGDLLFKLEDRHGRTAALGPTHEETVTELAKAGITSYKQLPLTLYQIQTKFRDEFRPRAGLLRGREFIMKDAYSFHLSVEGEGGLSETYDRLYDAYRNIFTRCGLDFSIVEAEAGPIGGSASHEFMVNAASGEDTILHCPRSGYAANVEKCEIGPREASFGLIPDGSTGELVKHHTPKMPGIEAVAEHLSTEPAGMLKTIVFEPADAKLAGETSWVLAVVRGDHEVNEGKVRDAVGFAVQLADEKRAKEAGFKVGYVSPRAAGQVEGCRVLIDPDACRVPEGLGSGGAAPGGWATGADEYDHHETGFDWQRDLGMDLPETPATVRDHEGPERGSVKIASVRNAVPGDPSPRDPSAELEARRGIEVGHIFKLGSKYSEAFKFTVLDPGQKPQTVVMGCYGIGVSRTLAACVEQAHDEHGISWPAPIAPYHCLVVLLDDEFADTARDIADGLAARGIDVLIDDRKERPGVKFKDADLIGVPTRVTVAKKAMEAGGVEFKKRTEAGKGEVVPVDAAIGAVVAALA
ncbi:MAG: proline--tRNA ligase [Planctomycetota bacterium]